MGTDFGGITDLNIGPDGLLYVLSLGLGKIFVIFGQATLVDFDGNGKADIAVYNASIGLWSIVRSSDGVNTLVVLGGAPEDIPLN